MLCGSPAASCTWVPVQDEVHVVLRADDGDGDGDEDLEADMAMEFAEHAELGAEGRRISGGVGISDDEDGGPADDGGGGSEDEDGDDLDGGSEGIEFDVRIPEALGIVIIIQLVFCSASASQFQIVSLERQGSGFMLFHQQNVRHGAHPALRINACRCGPGWGG